MKTRIFSTLLVSVLAPSWCVSQSSPGKPGLAFTPGELQQETHTVINDKLWGELNLGYSSRGPGGGLSIHYLAGRKILGANMYKAHNCDIHGNDHGHFSHDHSSGHHRTIEALGFHSGILIPGSWNLVMTAGVSVYKFNYMSTKPTTDDFTLPNIWATIINRDYQDELIVSRRVRTIGFPVEMKAHLWPDRFTGLSVGLRADLNLHSSFFSAHLGIRLGRHGEKRIKRGLARTELY